MCTVLTRLPVEPEFRFPGDGVGFVLRVNRGTHAPIVGWADILLEELSAPSSLLENPICACVASVFPSDNLYKNMVISV